MLADLLALISLQPPDLLARCQVHVLLDNGEQTIGAKRNQLLYEAYGRYVVFIDDDDAITPAYLTRIFEGIDQGVDHVGVGMRYAPLNGRHSLVECSMRHEWGYDEATNTYLRGPQHICAVKRRLALIAGFPDVSFGEDRAYSEALKPLIKSEFVITEPIYTYIDRGHAA